MCRTSWPKPCLRKKASAKPVVLIRVHQHDPGFASMKRRVKLPQQACGDPPALQGALHAQPQQPAVFPRAARLSP